MLLVDKKWTQGTHRESCVTFILYHIHSHPPTVSLSLHSARQMDLLPRWVKCLWCLSSCWKVFFIKLELNNNDTPSTPLAPLQPTVAHSISVYHPTMSAVQEDDFMSSLLSTMDKIVPTIIPCKQKPSPAYGYDDSSSPPLHSIRTWTLFIWWSTRQRLCIPFEWQFHKSKEEAQSQ